MFARCSWISSTLLLCALSPLAFSKSDCGNSKDDFPYPSIWPWVGIHLNASLPQDPHAKCVEDSGLLKRAFEDKLLWATRMVDASATHVIGALWGQRHQLGSFDGCLHAGESSPLGGARYCLVRMAVHHSLPAEREPPRSPWSVARYLPPTEDARPVLSGRGQLEGYFPPGEVLVAQCVPLSCSPAALEAAAVAALQHSAAAPELSVPPQFCQDSAELSRPAPRSAVLFWSIVGIFTVVTFTAPYLGWTWLNWRDHVKALARQDPPLEGMNVTSLSGIRFLVAIFIIGSHGVLTILTGALSNISMMNPVEDSQLVRVIVLHAQCFTNTFLFMSGLLFVLCHNHFSSKKIVLTRFLRLLPPYLVVIAFITFAAPSLGSGPLWKHLVHRESDGCMRWWWLNLLFVNNFFGVSEGEDRMCMPQSWSYAVDIQLTVLSALWRPRERSLRALLLVLALAVAAVFHSHYAYGWPALLLRTPQPLQNLYSDPHYVFGCTRTHLRAGPYVVGLIFGVLLLRLKKRAFHLSGVATNVLTGFSILLLLCVFLSSSYINQLELLNAAFLQAAFASLTPVLLSCGWGLLLIALVFGEETLVRKLFSWQPIVTLSRLAYSASLTNFILQAMFIGSTHDPRKLDTLTAFSQMFSDLIFILLISFWLYIVVEAPARKMAKYIADRMDQPVPDGVTHKGVQNGKQKELKNS